MGGGILGYNIEREFPPSSSIPIGSSVTPNFGFPFGWNVNMRVDSYPNGGGSKGWTMNMGHSFGPNIAMKKWNVTHLWNWGPWKSYNPCEFWHVVKI